MQFMKKAPRNGAPFSFPFLKLSYPSDLGLLPHLRWLPAQGDVHTALLRNDQNPALLLKTAQYILDGSCGSRAIGFIAGTIGVSNVKRRAIAVSGGAIECIVIPAPQARLLPFCSGEARDAKSRSLAARALQFISKGIPHVHQQFLHLWKQNSITVRQGCDVISAIIMNRDQISTTLAGLHLILVFDKKAVG